MFNNIYKNKRVLVTGHTGFKGSWLICWLQKLGAVVCGYSLEPSTIPNHFDLIAPEIDSHIGNILDMKSLDKVLKEFEPEIVFHLAAQPLVRKSYREPVDTFETNVMGTVNVLEASRLTSSVKVVINVTTDKCYENKEWVWGYKETDPMGGHDPYSASKGCSELVSASYRNSFGNDEFLIATARAGNVIGGGDWAEDRLIPDIMKAISLNECVDIRNPIATRPWQHVLEPLSGYLQLGQKLLEGRKEFADAWNFGPAESGNLSVCEVVSQIQSIWDINVTFPQEQAKLHEATLLKLDCSKAHTLLKWKPVLTNHEMIKATVNWYKEFYDNERIITASQLDTYIESAHRQESNWTN